jgi:hypothetical protein
MERRLGLLTTRGAVYDLLKDRALTSNQPQTSGENKPKGKIMPAKLDTLNLTPVAAGTPESSDTVAPPKRKLGANTFGIAKASSIKGSSKSRDPGQTIAAARYSAPCLCPVKVGLF